MSRQDRLIHAVAFETARTVEQVVAFPRSKRALMFFEVFVCIKRALERLNEGDHLKPGLN